MILSGMKIGHLYDSKTLLATVRGQPKEKFRWKAMH